MEYFLESLRCSHWQEPTDIFQHGLPLPDEYVDRLCPLYHLRTEQHPKPGEIYIKQNRSPVQDGGFYYSRSKGVSPNISKQTILQVKFATHKQPIFPCFSFILFIFAVRYTTNHEKNHLYHFLHYFFLSLIKQL